MKMYIPVPDFRKSAQILDRELLRQTALECATALRSLTGVEKLRDWSWKSRPGIEMWRTYECALYTYFSILNVEMVTRGMKPLLYPLPMIQNCKLVLPHWFGEHSFHVAQQSELIRTEKLRSTVPGTGILVRKQGQKSPDYYRSLFPDVPDNIRFYWPKPAEGTNAGYICNHPGLRAVAEIMS